MRIEPVNWRKLDNEEQARALERPAVRTDAIRATVADIIESVRREGDRALFSLNREIDGCDLEQLRIPQEELHRAASDCDAAFLESLQEAAARIQKFHQAFIPSGGEVWTAPGLRCSLRYDPLESAGLYVPGGTAPLVSTVLMLGIPARLAGCTEIVLCTPPRNSATAPCGAAPELLAAAHLCGVESVFLVGGAQAIAAMAYGTESIPKCSKLFGPGNAWVTEAKKQVSLDPAGAAIDMPAGASEVVVIADETADPVAVAWDLLSQAEHGPDSQVMLLTDSQVVADAVARAVAALAPDSERSDILAASLACAKIIVVEDLESAIRLSNRYAPEHLIINTRNAGGLADKARNVGSVFVGPWTPESLGDYCSGTNHVLPTNGWARSHAGLSVMDFMRRVTVQEASFEALRAVGPVAETLALFEGLQAHRMAVRHRIEAGTRS